LLCYANEPVGLIKLEKTMGIRKSICSLALTAIATTLGGTALAAPETFTIDPSHTFPSFETNHMGLSTWRGKFNKTSGSVVYDQEGKAGTVDITIDTTSVDTGQDTLNEHLAGEHYLDTAKFPTATYKGKLSKFVGDKPTEVEGQFTLKGVTKPLTLKINSFNCKPHPMTKKYTCGADVSASFNREDFGVAGMGAGETKLLISVEGSKN
jgi:polyisoprenoid-binding protein YceI